MAVVDSVAYTFLTVEGKPDEVARRISFHTVFIPRPLKFPYFAIKR
jgi:hypothetical protein